MAALLSHLDLRPTDEATANSATALGASYGRHAADAVHLATAVSVGADRFITNNASDFSKDIAEIDVAYPSELPQPTEPWTTGHCGRELSRTFWIEEHTTTRSPAGRVR